MAWRSSSSTGRRRQRGESIVEGMLSMLLLCLILFGLLQLFQMYVAQMFSQYSAFKTAWASSLGYSDEYLRRVALTSMAGASGRLISPGENYGSMTNLSRREIEVIPGSTVTWGLGYLPAFRAGQTWVDYQYWHTDNNQSRTYCLTPTPVRDSANRSVSATVGFANYPMLFTTIKERMPSNKEVSYGDVRVRYNNDDLISINRFVGMVDDTLDISSTATMRDSSSIFINED